jgi:CRISPR-associated protein Csy3
MANKVAASDIKTNTATFGSLSNFAINRALMPTKGYMYSVMPDERLLPVLVNESTQLGSQSQYAASTDYKKASTGNPQRVEEAFLHQDSDTLVVKFGLDVLFDLHTANIEMCNMSHAEKRIKALVSSYANAGGFDYLATLYAERIAHGYALWRNGKGFDRTVSVTAIEGTNKHRFEFVKDKKQNTDFIASLSTVIAKGLKGEFITLEVEMRSKLGKGSAVYPSQEFVNSTSKFDPSRVYFKDEHNHALVHSQKIGNALRTIDIWHPEYDEVGAIAIEPFGSSSRKASAYRHKTGDFYTYLKDVIYSNDDSNDGMARVNHAKTIEQLNAISDAHYFAAVLLRGGVFGMGKQTKADKKTDEDSEASDE